MNVLDGVENVALRPQLFFSHSRVHVADVETTRVVGSSAIWTLVGWRGRTKGCRREIGEVLRNKLNHIALRDANNLKEISASIIEVEKASIVLANHRENILWWKRECKPTTPKLSRMLLANVTDFIVLLLA